MRTPVACPWYAAKNITFSTPTIAYYFFIGTALFILYNIGGIIYNKKKRNLEGVEAIPHIEMWRKLPKTLHKTFVKASDKAIIGIALARGYINQKINGYKGV